VSGVSPPVRSDHSAIRVVDTSGPISDDHLRMMVIFGGRDDNGAPYGDVWRLFKQGGNYVWSSMIVSGMPPSARFGHAAFYDTSTVFVAGVPDTVNRMIVFGGTSGVGQTPTDGTAYELRFNRLVPGSATWAPLDTVDLGFTPPAPRYWHAVQHDHVLRQWRNPTAQQIIKPGHATFMFGGALGNNAYSDELWILWTFQDGRVGWEKRTYGGTAPSARARHSMGYDEAQGRQGHGGHGGTQGYGRLYIYGGENAAGPVDRFTRVLDPWPHNLPAALWSAWDDHDVTLAGHSAVVDYELTLSRVSEVWDPTADTWQKYPDHPMHWHHTYPVNFAVPGSTTPGGRLITVGQDSKAYWLDIPAAGQSPPNPWAPSGGLDAGFTPQTGVMYEPGKIMVAGGTDAGGVTGTTKTLDATAPSPAWAPSGAMSPRFYHNLVLLPTGQVLVVGGYATTSQQGHANAVKRPQLWTPSTGTWTALTQLPEQPTVRGYHSTAILLPDGRVLSASGEFTHYTGPPPNPPWHDHQYLANLYCPKYLYKNDGTTLAQRPQITSAPASLGWGGTFTLCTPNPSQITRVRLLRPGATTHTFDENQRYVPLSFSPATNPNRLLVTGPASADDAPPGYYLLFITGVVDGGETLPDVPSIARWVQVGSSVSDLCDTVVPAAAGGFTTTRVCNDATAMDLAWTAPADDGLIPESGKAQLYEVRQSTTDPGADVLGWFETVAEPVWPPPPSPAVVTTPQAMQVTGLTPSTWYWFAIRAVDDNNGKGTIKTKKILTLWIDCGEGFAGGGEGGGGASLERDAGTFALLPGGGQAPAVEGNSLFESAQAAQPAVDALQLPDPGGERVTAWVRAAAGHAASVDRARLFAVEHDPAERAFVARDRVVVGELAAALAVTDRDGADVTAAVATADGLWLPGGSWLDVTLEAEPAGEHTLHLEAQRAAPRGDPAVTGIVVEVEGATGWQPVERLHPRRTLDPLVAPLGTARWARLRFDSDALVRAIGSVRPGRAAAAITEVSPSSVAIADTELPGAPLGDVDGTTTGLVGPGELGLAFDSRLPGADRRRSLFLLLDATLALDGAAAEARSHALDDRALTFALHPSRPNPMTRRTTIAFDLAAATAVTLDLYDPQGRRVVRLAEGWLGPGRHARTWDARDERGHPVPRGVYVCQLGSRAFTARRKLIVLP
jgi:hypothetical protein